MFKRKRISFENPFIFNITWLFGLSILTLFLLFEPCIKLSANELVTHIIGGVFYSAVVLLINEIVQLFRDASELGILRGKYFRRELYELLPNGKRAEELTSKEREAILSSGKEVSEGSKYAKFRYGVGSEWWIDLKYLYKGSYYGLAKYHDWRKHIDSKAQADVLIALHLNDDSNTGSGTYMYNEINDYGEYSFQINSDRPQKIIIRYKNIIPSGIAEGYEIWEKE